MTDFYVLVLQPDRLTPATAITVSGKGLRKKTVLKEGWSGLIKDFRSCVKIEVAVLGSPSLIVLIASVGIKQC